MPVHITDCLQIHDNLFRHVDSELLHLNDQVNEVEGVQPKVIVETRLHDVGARGWLASIERGT